VAQQLAEQHDWLRVIALAGEAVPTRGGPIARAFQAGLTALDPPPDVVVIVDADVSMEPDYFARLLEKFALDATLGIASGSRFEHDGQSWLRHNATGVTVEGQCRAYRWACLPDVLPLDDSMGWDGIDAIKANLRGWSTGTFLDLGFRHHRLVGTRDGSRAKAWASEGRGAYYMGYRPYYLVFRALHHARREPGALGMIWGYASEAMRRAPRCADREVVDFLRSEQSIGRFARRVREATGRATM